MDINEQLKNLRLQRDHIITNNKDDNNYEEQLQNIEKQIENIEYSKKFNNLKNSHNINRNLYSYTGPVYEFETKVKNTCTYKTHAVNKKQAINNIKYQIKKDLKRTKDAKIDIDTNKVIVYKDNK